MSSEQPKEKGENPTMEQAWQQFALYDKNAILLQKNSRKLQIWVLALGVAATIMALTQTQLITLSIIAEKSWQKTAFQYVIIIIPIIISVIIAASNRFKAGNKWLLLRAGAEAIKQEIYRFRTLTKIAAGQQEPDTSSDEKLVDKITKISSQIMQTEINLTALQPYAGPIPPKMYGASGSDDGFSFLTPESYIEMRLDDQLNYYSLKIVKLEKKLKFFQWLIYIMGGAGTLVAAIGFELWVALTTSLAGVFASYLEYQQVENSLIIYNQAAASLSNIKTWWRALPNKKKREPENVEKLVENTEKILQNEMSGWVQQMQDAFEKFRASEGSKGGKK
jgi:hypothetical protein